MHDTRRTFLKDAIIGTASLTLGSLALGGCSSASTRETGTTEPRAQGASPVKTLILCISYHHKNTLKIATAMAGVLNAQVKTPQDLRPGELGDYDLIGFGSGIYSQQHDPRILELVDKEPAAGKKAFIFSTSGVSRAFALKYAKDIDDPHTVLRDTLTAKQYAILGEFNCRGWNTNSFLIVFGGLNKFRPNADDLANATTFASGLIPKALA